MAEPKKFNNELLTKLAVALLNGNGDTIKSKYAQDAFNEGVTLPQMGELVKGVVTEHPFKALGLGALGAGNIGGLIDNDKFGGQLGGLALGGLGASMFATNPYAKAMITLGGGELGTLFDKLRSKKEQSSQQYNKKGY